MGQPRCADCRFSREWNHARGPAVGGNTMVRLQCRRYPPVHAPDHDEVGPDETNPRVNCYSWSFPVVLGGDWCGEFRRKPEVSDAQQQESQPAAA